jgi:hypothetical protein
MPSPTAKPITIQYRPKDLPQRFGRWPRKVEKDIEKTMHASLLAAQESIPAYPSRRSSLKDGTAKQRRWFFWAVKHGKASYTRRVSGGIAGSLGLGSSGQKMGKPSIYYVRKIGSRSWEGVMGSNKPGVEYVIGDAQARMHRPVWWRFSHVRRRAMGKILKLWNDLTVDLAHYLDGKGSV